MSDPVSSSRGESTRHLPPRARTEAPPASVRELLARSGADDTAVDRAGICARGGAPFGRYLAAKEIARGGMSEVLEAIDPELGRAIALKVLDAELARDPELVLKFLREARITGQLDHPHIVPVHEIGVDDAGRLYFSMKRIEGRSLAALIDELAGARPRRVVRARLLGVFLKVCDAMRFAHARGIIHRDLKPANILVGQYGEVYVCDWGLAKRRGTAERPLARELRSADALGTQDGTVMGTPQYMPPEQAMGLVDQIDHRSDIYALGAILYHLLSFERPFASDQPTIVIQLAATGEVVPPSARAPDVDIPRELEAVVLKAMAYKPADRYPSVEALEADIEAYLAGRALTAVRYTTGQLVRKWAWRHRVGLAVAALVLCAVGGVQLAGAIRERRERMAREQTQLALLAELGQALVSCRAELLARTGPEAAPLVEPNGELRREAFGAWCEAHGRAQETLHRIAELGRRAETARVRAASRIDEVLAEQRRLALEAARRSAELGEAALARVWIDRAVSAGLAGAEHLAALAAVDATERTRLDADLSAARELLAAAAGPLASGAGFFEQAVAKLARRRSPALVRLLLDPAHLDSPHELVRLICIEALGRLGDASTPGPGGLDAVARLSAMLAQADPAVDLERATALARALGFLGDSRGYAPLRAAQRAAGEHSLFTQRTASALRQLPLPPELASAAAPADARYERAVQLVERGDFAAAWSALEGLQREHPHSAGLANQMGHCLLVQGRLVEALPHFDRAAELEPASAAWRVNRADCLRRLGRISEAAAELDRAIELDPSLAPAYMRRGQLRHDARQLEPALADLERAVALDPRSALSRRYLGMVLVSLGRNADAVSMLDTAIGLDATDAFAYLNRGSAHHNLGHSELALSDFGSALRLDPGMILARANRSLTLTVLGKHEEALADIDRALIAQPQDAEFLTRRAQILLRAGRIEAARVTLERARSLDPGSLRIMTVRAELARAAGELPALEAVLGEVLAISPDEPNARCERGQLRFQRRAFAEALADFEHMVAAHPAMWQGWAGQGQSLARLGHTEAALASLREARARATDAATQAELDGWMRSLR